MRQGVIDEEKNYEIIYNFRTIQYYIYIYIYTFFSTHGDKFYIVDLETWSSTFMH